MPAVLALTPGVRYNRRDLVVIMLTTFIVFYGRLLLDGFGVVSLFSLYNLVSFILGKNRLINRVTDCY